MKKPRRKNRKERRKALPQPVQAAAAIAPEPQPPTILPSKPNSGQNSLKRFWKVVGVIALLVGLVSSLFNVFIPRISVSPASTLDPRNPFLTPFGLLNEGRLPIHSVHFSSSITKIETRDLTITDCASYGLDDHYERLGAAKRTTIGFYAPYKLGPINSAIAEMIVEYRPSFWPRKLKQRFKFKIAKTASGEMVWLPIQE